MKYNIADILIEERNLIFDHSPKTNSETDESDIIQGGPPVWGMKSTITYLKIIPTQAATEEFLCFTETINYM